MSSSASERETSSLAIEYCVLIYVCRRWRSRKLAIQPRVATVTDVAWATPRAFKPEQGNLNMFDIILYLENFQTFYPINFTIC